MPGDIPDNIAVSIHKKTASCPCEHKTVQKHCGAEFMYTYSENNESGGSGAVLTHWIIGITPLGIISDMTKKVKRKIDAKIAITDFNEKESQNKKVEPPEDAHHCYGCGSDEVLKDYFCCYECDHCIDCCDGSCSCCCNSHCGECMHLDPEDCTGKCWCCDCGHCGSCGCDDEEECINKGGCACCCITEEGNIGDNELEDMPKAKASVAEEVVRMSKKKLEHADWKTYLGTKEILPELGKFYLFMALGDKELFEEHTEQLAQKMLNYLVVSCAGESRHLFGIGKGKTTTMSPTAQGMIKGMKTAYGGNTSGYSSARNSMWRTGYSLAQKFGYPDVLKALEQIFSNLKWGSGTSYGGKAWAKIARHALMYANEEINSVLFIDGVMAIAHNGGWAYNKYYKGSYSGLNFQTFLNFKRDADEKSIWRLLTKLSIPDTSDGEKALWEEGKKRIPSMKTPAEKKDAYDKKMKKKTQELLDADKIYAAKKAKASGKAGGMAIHDDPFDTPNTIKFGTPKPIGMPPSKKPQKKGKKLTVQQLWDAGAYSETYKKELLSFKNAEMKQTPTENEIIKLIEAEKEKGI